MPGVICSKCEDRAFYFSPPNAWQSCPHTLHLGKGGRDRKVTDRKKRRRKSYPSYPQGLWKRRGWNRGKIWWQHQILAWLPLAGVQGISVYECVLRVGWASTTRFRWQRNLSETPCVGRMNSALKNKPQPWDARPQGREKPWARTLGPGICWDRCRGFCGSAEVTGFLPIVHSFVFLSNLIQI